MPSPDQALRRLVFDLGALSADDAAAVLDQLDPPHRKKIEALLRELSEFGFGQNLPKPADELPGIDVSCLSPWLIERLKSGRDTISMTTPARATLRDCAARLCPAPPTHSARSVKNFSRGAQMR
jgi:hypothetical protein